MTEATGDVHLNFNPKLFRIVYDDPRIIITRLREKGLKVTPQRGAIIEVLIERRGLHPSVRLVYNEARKKKLTSRSGAPAVGNQIL